MMNKRISSVFCNKKQIAKVESVYETAQKDTEHFSSMSFNKSNTQNARRNRNRKVVWFNK